MYALIDCNNFYASCERLFRPDLINKPILVLSNNDGCVIARSNEAKALGIKMGEPFFQIKALCASNQVHVFSSNYTFYGDMSQRVMSVIESAWPHVEIYSIDEAFLDLTTLPLSKQTLFCSTLQKLVLKITGIPTSIGIGKTKTLAKVANHICKKELKIPVFNLAENQRWLEKIAIGDVWGIGRQWENKLRGEGIFTALDLAKTNAQGIRQRYNVVLMRTTMELQGIPCLELEVIEPKQSILSSKSFGQMQTSQEIIAQAISSHCHRVWEKLRAQDSVAQYLSVFVLTNRFRADLPQYSKSMQFKLINPSDDLSTLTKIAKLCLTKLYQRGFHYKKVGVCLEGLIPKNPRQFDMFNQLDEGKLNKKEQIMQTFEAINRKYGHKIIQLAAESSAKPWAMRAELKSPSYTTRWTDLPIVKS
ncbi:MAG: Y-family DNA polymerase [Tatlockia sp.]|jgi:DNA polymerase V